MTTLITGGTGFVGRALIKQLKHVNVTSRDRLRAQKILGDSVDLVIPWDPDAESLSLLDSPHFDSVINLMGEPIAEGRWTPKKKERIRNSRVQGTRKLVDALIDSRKLPRVFVTGSAVGIYGDSGDAFVEENHEHGTGFLTDVCEEWESTTQRLSDHGVRVVHLRMGIVLGSQGGAMKKLTPLFRMCVGGRLGNGKQWMAWIHVQDLVSMTLWAIENESVSGPVNATAPNPVRNAEFTKELAKAVGRPAILPAPRFGVRLALGEFANSLFVSQRAIPAVALANGFQFKFPDIRSAINAAIEKERI